MQEVETKENAGGRDQRERRRWRPKRKKDVETKENAGGRDQRECRR
jgi:hypothetical protein